MDRRAQQRLYVLNRVLADELTVEAAAQVLKLSIRQTRRLVERYRSAGAGGLVHGNRGRFRHSHLVAIVPMSDVLVLEAIEDELDLTAARAALADADRAIRIPWTDLRAKLAR